MACALGALSAATAQEAAILYLEVSVNDRPTGLIMPFAGAPGSLRTSAANLRQLGVAAGAIGSGDGEVALDAIAGLRYSVDMAAQTLALQLDDALRAPFLAAARSAATPPPASASPGAVFNYDAVAQFGTERAILLTGELRAFNHSGAFVTNGSMLASRARKHALRYDSYWQWADGDTLRVVQVGDLITGSLSWSRALRVGGVQWRKNFALRPDLLTYPTASVNGSALVPSALTLYINGVQQYSSAVPDGPFVLGQVAGINGAGQARVVTRDALGRASVTELPLYVDTRMLAAGLWDYSFEAGALRRQFGQRSFDYGTPQVAASARYGVNPAVTLEGHAEAGEGVINAGLGTLLALRQYGVLSAHLAASGGQTRGHQASIGYQYLAHGFSIDIARMHASAGFADLAARAGAPVPRAQHRWSLGLLLPQRQSVALSQIVYQPADGAAARISALSYSATLGQGVFASLSAFSDARNRANRGLYASISFAFGERSSASAGMGRQNGLRQRAVQAMRAPDFAGGAGWNVQAGQSGESTFAQAQVRMLGRSGQVGASAWSTDGKGRVLLDASGALVAMDGTLAAARQVGNGFALVSTGVAGVPVTHENRIIGVTGADGHLLVPNLNPYAANRVGIEVGALAADARVPTSSTTVVPRNLSGVLVRLPIERYRAASVIMRTRGGAFLAPGTPLRHRESGAETVVGHDGIAFIDQLAPHNTLDAGEGASACVAQFDYLHDPDRTLPVIGPVECRSAP